MIRNLSLLAAILVVHPIAWTQVVIDGKFEDWAGCETVNHTIQPDTLGVPLKDIHIAHNAEAVFLQLHFTREVNLQSLESSLAFHFDADGDQQTGTVLNGMSGIDMSILFAPTDEAGAVKPGFALLVHQGDEPTKRLINEITLHMSPTHGSQRFEVRIDRDMTAIQPKWFKGPHFHYHVAMWNAGDSSRRSNHFSYRLHPTGSAPAPKTRPTHIDFARNSESDLRVLSWNVGRNITKAPEAFIRILSVLKPDIMLLDELDKNTTEQEIQAFKAGLIQQGLGPELHHVFTSGESKEKAMVMSRLPMDATAFPRAVPHNEARMTAFMEAMNNPQINKLVQVRMTQNHSLAGAVIKWADHRILAVSMDLECCGRTGEPQDQFRMLQVTDIREAVTRFLSESPVSAILIGGDFNLVGSVKPLLHMQAEYINGHGPLQIIDAYQFDNTSNATWRNPEEPFLPGRLDFMLHDKKTMTPRRSFVFDSDDLSPSELNGILPEDSRTASDHLPIVVDFKLNRISHQSN